MDKLQIENNASKNVISGFKTSGIYPLDKKMILKKLPTFQTNFDESRTDGEKNGSNCGETFEQFLSESRTSETKNLRKKKRKKVSAKPGEYWCKKRPKRWRKLN